MDAGITGSYYLSLKSPSLGQDQRREVCPYNYQNRQTDSSGRGSSSLHLVFPSRIISERSPEVIELDPYPEAASRVSRGTSFDRLIQ